MPTSQKFSASKDKNQAGLACRQAGIIHLWLILIIIGIILGGVFLSNQFKLWIKPLTSVGQQTSTPTVSSSPTSASSPQQVKKDDLAALEKYCKEEALKLPEAPFKYETKEGPRTSGAMAWISKLMPEDRRISKHKSCSMTYSFNGKSAYAQMGTVYPTESNQFDAAVIRNLLGKIDSSWERVLEADKSPDKFALIFKRENLRMGTVDYVDVFSGGLVLYMKFNTYYK